MARRDSKSACLLAWIFSALRVSIKVLAALTLITCRWLKCFARQEAPLGQYPLANSLQMGAFSSSKTCKYGQSKLLHVPWNSLRSVIAEQNYKYKLFGRYKSRIFRLLYLIYFVMRLESAISCERKYTRGSSNFQKCFSTLAQQPQLASQDKKSIPIDPSLWNSSRMKFSVQDSTIVI